MMSIQRNQVLEHASNPRLAEINFYIDNILTDPVAQKFHYRNYALDNEPYYFFMIPGTLTIEEQGLLRRDYARAGWKNMLIANEQTVFCQAAQSNNVVLIRLYP